MCKIRWGHYISFTIRAIIIAFLLNVTIINQNYLFGFLTIWYTFLTGGKIYRENNENKLMKAANLIKNKIDKKREG